MFKINKRKPKYSKSKPSSPPQVNFGPVFTRVFRFSFNSTGIAILTRGNLLNIMLAADNGATTGVRVATSVLLNKISIYGVAAGVGSASSVTAVFEGPNAPSTQVGDTGNAFAMPCIAMRPPAESFAAMWSQNNFNESEELCRLSGATGDIVDLSVSFVIDNASTNPVTIPATATSGVFCSSPDNATVLRPVTLLWSGV